MAVTRTGIPIRVCWPATSQSKKLIRRSKTTSASGSSAVSFGVADRGFSPLKTAVPCSAAAALHHREKLRGESKERCGARPPGALPAVAANLQIKEVCWTTARS